MAIAQGYEEIGRPLEISDIPPLPPLGMRRKTTREIRNSHQLPATRKHVEYSTRALYLGTYKGYCHFWQPSYASPKRCIYLLNYQPATLSSPSIGDPPCIIATVTTKPATVSNSKPPPRRMIQTVLPAHRDDRLKPNFCQYHEAERCPRITTS